MAQKKNPGPRQGPKFTRIEKVIILKAVMPKFKELLRNWGLVDSPLAIGLKNLNSLPNVDQLEHLAESNWSVGYLSEDFRIVSYRDDAHRIPLPLRTDVPMKKVRGALNVLFPATQSLHPPYPVIVTNIKAGIEDVINRAQNVRNKSKLNLKNLPGLSHKKFQGMFRDLFNLLLVEFSGVNLRNVLASNVELRKKWGAVPADELRLNADTATWITLELFGKGFGARLKTNEPALKKKFQRYIDKGEFTLQPN